MLYLGIDLHRKQMTISLRNELGDVLLRRQVSTRREKVEEFLEQVHQLGAADGGAYVAILEVCGFHGWLVRRLQQDEACREVVVIQPATRSRKKTDRRDANAISELLWVNRDRLLRGERVQGVRRIYLPQESEQQDRLLTTLRVRLVWKRTETLNQIHQILRRNNLEWDRPTKTFQTKKVRQWLQTLALSEVERMDLDQLLTQWELWEQQLAEVDTKVEARFEHNEDAKLLATIPGVSMFSALAIACRIGPISRFPRGRSLANFFGLTPGSRSSGETERLGSITKEGSRMVRFLLGQAIFHVLRCDGKIRAWYKQIKRRRGANIARVAVMRRLVVIMWHMLTKREAWQPSVQPERTRPAMDDPRTACKPIDRQAVLDQYPAPSTPSEVTSQSTGSSSLLSDEEVELCQA